MKDKRHIAIKNRMLKYVVDVWGIKDPKRIDPVVDLFLDVFSFEVSRLHQEIENSDTQLLHRLSRILVSNQWSLPVPSHALMTILPAKDEIDLMPEDHFFAEKSLFGMESFSLFFTPLAKHKLTDAKVNYLIYDRDLILQEPRVKQFEKIIEHKNKIDDYCVWVGLEISDDFLEESSEISFCLLPEEGALLPYLNMIQAFDLDGNQHPINKIKFEADNTDESHYFDTISSFYEEQFYSIKLNDYGKKKKSLGTLFPNIPKNNDDLNLDKELFWFKLVLPEVFTSSRIASTRIYTNTFPVVNRFLRSREHNFQANGKIVSMPSSRNTLFLNVNSVHDGEGSSYKNVLKSNDDKLQGTFSLYFGDIERFDSSSARALIHKIFRLIREDGNAFAAMNPEGIDNRLKDLITRLDKFELQVGEVDREDQKDRAFLQVTPYDEITYGTIQYWLTNGDLANGLDEDAYVQQFSTEKFDTPQLKFRTQTTGGVIRKNEQELIDSLRYGLLTRDRIVSREDVKSFIKKQIGKHIEDLKIKDGVGISPHKKGGLVRTTEVMISLKDEPFEKEYLSKFAIFLEKEMVKRSVSNSYYRVLFN